MAGLVARVRAELDERSASEAANELERKFSDSARTISEQYTGGFKDAGRAAERMATDAQGAYRRMGDATDEVARKERELSEARTRGAGDVDRLAREVEQARGREVQAIREATSALTQYEETARNVGSAGEEASRSFVSGFGGITTALRGAGGEAASGFVDGFGSSGALARLGTAGGPIGVAIAGIAALGYATGKTLVEQIEQGMASSRIQDTFRARLGLDEATTARAATAAGNAYTNAFGESIKDNLGAIQFGIQGGLIDRGATDAEMQTVTQQMQALAGTMNADLQQIAHAGGQLIRGGLANNAEQALDIIAAGAQRGLDISGDWLDTVGEYTTQWRKLGIDGSDAIGLIQQGLQGAARDSDVVADSLKEFSIRAVDGSKTTAEGFAALGFNADDMSRRFAVGGESARSSFGAVLSALRDLDDPMQQKLAWVDLFGTQFEDMGDAINELDLSKARTEIGSTTDSMKSMTDQLGQHTSGWDTLDRQIDTTFGHLKQWLADTDIGKFFGQGLPNAVGGIFRDLNDSIDFNAGRRTIVTGTTDGSPGVPFAPGLIGPGAPGSPGLGGATPIAGAGGLLLPSLQGPPPPGGLPGAAAAPPVPGARTPIVPSADQGGGGGASSAKPSFAASQYSIDAIPLGQFGGVGLGPLGVPSAGSGAPGSPGFGGGANALRVFDAETGLQNARQSVESARVRVLELEADNTSTAQDIAAAKNQVQNSERAYLSAEAKLIEAQRGTYDKMSSAANSMSKGMDQIGAALDNDLGISKGLPGIADNLVRFLASLAAAPMMGQLAAQSAARPNEGSGIIGQLASQGAFGPRFVGGAAPGGSVAAGGGGYGGFGAAQGGTGVAGFPASPAGSFSGGSARDFAHNVMMPFWESQGLKVGDHAADKYGEHQNGALDIMVDNIAEGNAVLRQVLSDPNVHGAIFNNKTYGYGHGTTPQDYSAGHTGDPSQDHLNHVHAWYEPGNAGNITPLPSTGGFGVGPVAPTPTPAWGPGGAGPAPIYAGGGQSPVLFGDNPIAGASAGAGMSGFGGANTRPLAQTTGTPFMAMPGGSGPGLGGAPMDAAMTAASGLDLLAPGAGAAAQTTMKLANRAIQYAGQVAGIGVSGLMETFLPTGSEKASKGWVQRLAAGAASARPALPNMAGGQTPPQAPGQGGGGVGGSVDQSNTTNINVTNQRATEDGTGKDIAFHLGAQNSGTRW